VASYGRTSPANASAPPVVGIVVDWAGAPTLADIPEEAYRPRGPVLPNATQAA
jgi:hypothetical protein